MKPTHETRQYTQQHRNLRGFLATPNVQKAASRLSVKIKKKQRKETYKPQRHKLHFLALGSCT